MHNFVKEIRWGETKWKKKVHVPSCMVSVIWVWIMHRHTRSPVEALKAAARLQRVSSAHISVLTVIIRHKSLLTLSLSLCLSLSLSVSVSVSLSIAIFWQHLRNEHNRNKDCYRKESQDSKPPSVFPKKKEETVSWYVQRTRASSDIILHRWWTSRLNRCWCWPPGRRNPSLQCCCRRHGGRRRIWLLHKLWILGNPNMSC
jgi:hypothetical protein